MTWRLKFSKKLKTDFQFSLGPDQPAITPADALWAAPLPMAASAFQPDGLPPEGHITYGDYFSAARHYLTQNRLAVIGCAIEQLWEATEPPPAVDAVQINLLKHGAFYHPAQVVVALGSHQLMLVLNVAISQQGRDALKTEYANLERLNRDMPDRYLPQVFGQGQGDTPAGEHLPMFCGQWLQGYYEFHLTREADDANPSAVLWNTDTGTTALDAQNVDTILHQAARIMAYYFNPLTCEAIMAWHHGAGDFVVCPKADKIEVALITVRRYAAVIDIMLDENDPDLEALLNAWLVYLVQLSLRLRLDRLDGVGDPICYGDEVIDPICQGFWQGLAASFQARGLPAELLMGARNYFCQFDKRDLLDVAQAVLARLEIQPAEAQLLKAVMPSHLQQLSAVLSADQSTI